MDFGILFLLIFFVAVIIFWDQAVMPSRYAEREEARRIREYLKRRQSLIQLDEEDQKGST
jgi:hypothetical protein